MDSSSRYIKLMLLIHVAAISSILSNFPILRQVSGFVYLMFIPGFVILKIMNLKERNITDSILCSVGLSIVFLMFTGIVVNALYPVFGLSNPLSTAPLTITIMCLTIALLLISQRSHFAKALRTDFLAHMKLVSIYKGIIFLLPLFLTIVGVLYDSTPFLLLMIISVVIIFALTIFSHKFSSAELYPWALFIISLSLLLHTSLISKYVMGYDIHGEYYAFKLTESSGYWQRPGTPSFFSSQYNYESVISTTILPTIFSVMLNISGELVFKLIFSFVFSMVPLALYRIYELQKGKTFALLSTFFFMSLSYSFYGLGPLSTQRQMIAEFFLILSVFLLVEKSMDMQKRKMLFMIFGVGLILAHYSLAFIYLALVIFVFLSYRHGRTELLNKRIVLFLAVVTFSWYIYVSISPMVSLTYDIRLLVTNFSSDLLNPSARSSYVFTHLNPSTASSIVGLAHRLLIYVENLLIFIGIATLVMKKEKSFTREYQYFAVASGLILLLGLIVPNLAPTLNFDRFYAITLLFLAPFFVAGGETFLQLTMRMASFLFARLRTSNYHGQRSQVLGLRALTVVLIIAFLFQVGFVNHVTRVAPLSYSLDLSRMESTNDLSIEISLYEAYTLEQEVFSARWYSNNANKTSWIYADLDARNHVLTSYALLDRQEIHYLSNTTVLKRGSYVYLRYLNIRENIVITEAGPVNAPEIHLSNYCNVIYSSEYSEVYYDP